MKNKDLYLNMFGANGVEEEFFNKEFILCSLWAWLQERLRSPNLMVNHFM